MAARRIVLGITGGIAAYKTAQLVRDLKENGDVVQVVMTEAATQFITPTTLQALSGLPVFVDAWDSRIDNHMPHIELSRGADLIVIAPASADFLAKLAHGHADDLLSTLCIAREIPLLVAPAMNQAMWRNSAVERNVAQLKIDGVGFVGPDAGSQACGETGFGRMSEPSEIFFAIDALLTPKTLQGQRVVITAGPTVEPIDPVRVITNLSSGKMGYALAAACANAGAHVVLISGPTSLPTPFGVRRIDVQTAQAMYLEVQHQVVDADIFIAVAAVADWRVANVAHEKIKKQPGALPELTFVENSDILASVATLPKPPFCVGFAAESEQIEPYAHAKRQKKGVPLLFANRVQTALAADENEILVCDANQQYWLPKMNKRALARQLVAEILKRYAP